MTTTCDYLVIGGGSSGCVVPKRLAEKTKGRIILLEAGKSDEGDPAATDLTVLHLFRQPAEPRFFSSRWLKARFQLSLGLRLWGFESN
jgi:choline dehydrogenase-like flavoprotein